MDWTIVEGRCPRTRIRRTSARWLIAATILVGGCGTPPTSKRAQDMLPHKTFVLRAITVEQGVAFLSDLGLSEVSPVLERVGGEGIEVWGIIAKMMGGEWRGGSCRRNDDGG